MAKQAKIKKLEGQMKTEAAKEHFQKAAETKKQIASLQQTKASAFKTVGQAPGGMDNAVTNHIKHAVEQVEEKAKHTVEEVKQKAKEQVQAALEKGNAPAALKRLIKRWRSAKLRADGHMYVVAATVQPTKEPEKEPKTMSPSERLTGHPTGHPTEHPTAVPSKSLEHPKQVLHKCMNACTRACMKAGACEQAGVRSCTLMCMRQETHTSKNTREDKQSVQRAIKADYPVGACQSENFEFGVDYQGSDIVAARTTKGIDRRLLFTDCWH